MAKDVDKAGENQDTDDKNQDNTPGDDNSSPDDKKPAPDKDTATVLKVEAKKMAEDAEKRGRGRADKELSDKVKVLEQEAQNRKDADFTRIAKQYGMDEEKLKEAGITEASQIVAQAALFGKEAKKPVSLIDDGETDGGGENWRELPAQQRIQYGIKHK